MATTNAGTFTVVRRDVCINQDGSMVVNLLYTLSSNGATLLTRTLFMPADGSKILDVNGATVAAPAPSALTTALTSFLAQLDTTITNGAGASKLNI